MATRFLKNGFTIFEIVIVIAILGIIVTISVAAMQNMYRGSALKTTTDEIYRAFTEARNRTLASEGDTVYGVLVSTSSVTRFVGGTYTVGAVTNRTVAFDAGVTATGSIVMNEIPVVFTRLTGAPSTVGDIFIQDGIGNATRTLSIHASGLVEY